MKLNRKGWAVWPTSVCHPVEVIDYHGDKMCVVRVKPEVFDAIVLECRSINYHLEVGPEVCTFWMRIGYISRCPYTEDFKDFKGLKRIDRHILAGGKRHQFRPVKRKTKWRVYGHGRSSPFVGHQYDEFSTLASAVKEARGQILTLGLEVVEIGCDYSISNNRAYSSFGSCAEVEVYADGTVIVYRSRKAHNLKRLGDGDKTMQRGTYYRGFGKTKLTEFPTRRAWAGGRRQKYFVSVKAGDLK